MYSVADCRRYIRRRKIRRGRLLRRGDHRSPAGRFTDIGQIVKSKTEKIQTVYYGVKVNKYVIMPNYIHLIIMIDIENGRPMVAPTVSRIVNQLKGAVTKEAKAPF